MWLKNTYHELVGRVKSLFSKNFRPVRRRICPGCGEPIEPGEEGAWSKGRIWHSLDCYILSINKEEG